MNGAPLLALAVPWPMAIRSAAATPLARTGGPVPHHRGSTSSPVATTDKSYED